MEATTALDVEILALDAHLGDDAAIAGADDLEIWIDDDGGVSFGHDDAVYCVRSGAAWRVRLIDGGSEAELTCWKQGRVLRTTNLVAEPPDDDGVIRFSSS